MADDEEKKKRLKVAEGSETRDQHHHHHRHSDHHHAEAADTEGKHSRSSTSEDVRYVRWSNDREDPNWFNAPLDCFYLQEQLSDKEPLEHEASKNTKLVMFCAQGSDLWRKTAYNFVKDNGHAYLGAALKANRAIEVGFSVDTFRGQFDQGGVLVRENEENWVKAGVEFADGHLHLSVVATRAGLSDWSTAPWPLDWREETHVVIRVDRMGDALIARARLAKVEDNWNLLRVCPVSATAHLRAGPYSCAPIREGLFVEFSRYVEREGKQLH